MSSSKTVNSNLNSQSPCSFGIVSAAYGFQYLRQYPTRSPERESFALQLPQH